MDIHKPKAAHSWREFLVEIGTIILGILIALGLEQLAEHLRWEHAVAEARTAIREEIAFNAGFFQNRVTVSPCVDRRLEAIERALTAAEESGRVARVPGVALSLSGQVVDSQWRAAQAAQTLPHFPHDELAQLGRYYDVVDTLKRAWLDEEGEDWRWLSDLDGGPRTLSSPELAQLRYHLRGARWHNTVETTVYRRELDLTRKLGVKPVDRSGPIWTKVCADLAG